MLFGNVICICLEVFDINDVFIYCFFEDFIIQRIFFVGLSWGDLMDELFLG